MVRPVVRPPVRAAQDALLPDDDQVIGVVVEGKARAYSVRALSSMSGHIVNDLVKDVPVSVTYCNENRCTRVFTDEKRGTPLDISQAGYRDGLILRIGQGFYEQESGKSPQTGASLPYPRIPHELTTWKAWKEAHPETELYDAS
jgi:hypothetical protein